MFFIEKPKWTKIPCPAFMKVPGKWHQQCSNCLKAQRKLTATEFSNSGKIYGSYVMCKEDADYNNMMAEVLLKQQEARKMKTTETKMKKMLEEENKSDKEN